MTSLRLGRIRVRHGCDRDNGGGLVDVWEAGLRRLKKWYVEDDYGGTIDL